MEVAIIPTSAIKHTITTLQAELRNQVFPQHRLDIDTDMLTTHVSRTVPSSWNPPVQWSLMAFHDKRRVLASAEEFEFLYWLQHALLPKKTKNGGSHLSLGAEEKQQ